VPRDRVSYQHQVGLDAFAVRANQKSTSVLSGVFDLNLARQLNPQLTTAAD
jgi:uncharacterized protein (DUF934 family)